MPDSDLARLTACLAACVRLAGREGWLGLEPKRALATQPGIAMTVAPAAGCHYSGRMKPEHPITYASAAPSKSPPPAGFSVSTFLAGVAVGVITTVIVLASLPPSGVGVYRYNATRQAELDAKIAAEDASLLRRTKANLDRLTAPAN